MNSDSKNSPNFKLFALILTFVLMVTACKKENVCTLTPEQFPEIRGFKIGMAYDEITKRFSEVCLPDNAVDKKKITIYLLNYDNSNCGKDYLTYYANPENHHDLDGVSTLELTLTNNQLTDYKISYGTTNDVDFSAVFENKMMQTLNLADWSNWMIYDSSEEEEGESPTFEKYRRSMHSRNLSCNQVEVIIATEQTSPLEPDKLMKKGVINFASIGVYRTNSQALSQTEQENREKQEAQQREQDQNDYLKKQTEEKKKSESFQP